MKVNLKKTTAISVLILVLSGLTGCDEDILPAAASSAPKDAQTNSAAPFSRGVNGSPTASGSIPSANPSGNSPLSSTSSNTAIEIAGNCDSNDPEDNQWCERLSLARMHSQPAHVPVGDIPPDPNAGNVFSGPIIFRDTQLYIWLSSSVYAIEGYGSGYRNKQTFYFLPTGRFYYKTVMYYGQVSPEGNVKAIWGRYRFTDERGEQIEMETDQGENVVVQLRFGRSNLIWGDTTYGQVDWENEALRRQTGE
jgi:hypothetical protein